MAFRDSVTAARSGNASFPARRVDGIFLVILLAALAARLHLAVTAEFIHDENNTAIPLAQAISFSPDHLNLPLRGENHGALPAYVVKASGSLFGTSWLGYRLLHVVLGLCTVGLVFLLTREWYGPVAARWAAALFAFNEYSLAVSSRATAHVPHLFLVTLALYAISRFFASPRPGYLYLAGVSVGLAFYCKEHSALLVPVFFLALLQANYRRWLYRPHVYLACAVCLLLIAPDFIWNLKSDGERQITYGSQTLRQATYASHLSRFGGIGFSPYPSMFYFHDGVKAAYLHVTGTALKDETPEYPPMNLLLGVVLVGAIVITTARPSPGDPVRALLLILFWFFFLFFSSIKKGDPPGRLDPVSWIWVEATLIPATILAGARLAGAAGRWRMLAWGFAGIALVYAGIATT